MHPQARDTGFPVNCISLYQWLVGINWGWNASVLRAVASHIWESFAIYSISGKMVPSERFELPTRGLEDHQPVFHTIHNTSPEPIAAGSNVYHCFFGFIFQHPRRCHESVSS